MCKIIYAHAGDKGCIVWRKVLKKPTVKLNKSQSGYYYHHLQAILKVIKYSSPQICWFHGWRILPQALISGVNL